MGGLVVLIIIKNRRIQRMWLGKWLIFAIENSPKLTERLRKVVVIVWELEMYWILRVWVRGVKCQADSWIYTSLLDPRGGRKRGEPVVLLLTLSLPDSRSGTWGRLPDTETLVSTLTFNWILFLLPGPRDTLSWSRDHVRASPDLRSGVRVVNGSSRVPDPLSLLVRSWFSRGEHIKSCF